MNKQEEQEKQEKNELVVLLQNATFRSFMWNNVIEPSAMFDATASEDPIKNSMLLARKKMGVSMFENLMFADMESTFQMIREHFIYDEGNDK